mmetsp:Transcript_19071/g.26684  ORF Transcript_19071/g.26684 Transcript_19071/m.26684 type:complete len:152 (-) Transcript_19071:178-633(-)
MSVENTFQWLQSASYLLNAGQFENAIQECTNILNERSDCFLAYRIRAAAHLQLNHFQEAIDDCTKEFQLNKGSMKEDLIALTNRATIYNKVGDYEKALRDCNLVLQLSKHSQIREIPREALNQRTIAYNELGRYDDAMEDFTSYLEGTKFF